ncbi:MAG: hypothetical protein ABSE46_13610 [Terracidiphilus sp.]
MIPWDTLISGREGRAVVNLGLKLLIRVKDTDYAHFSSNLSARGLKKLSQIHSFLFRLGTCEPTANARAVYTLRFTTVMLA